MLKAAVASGQRQAVDLALWAACSGIKIKDNTHLDFERQWWGCTATVKSS